MSFTWFVYKAAQLAGLSRVEFLEQCGRYRVSVFSYSPEELRDELQADLETVREAVPSRT